MAEKKNTIITAHGIMLTDNNVVKTTKRTMKGWAADTMYLISQNVKGENNLTELLKEFPGYVKCADFCGKKDNNKLIIYGWYWHGNWADPSKEIVQKYYLPE